MWFLCFPLLGRTGLSTTSLLLSSFDLTLSFDNFSGFPSKLITDSSEPEFLNEYGNELLPWNEYIKEKSSHVSGINIRRRIRLLRANRRRKEVIFWFSLDSWLEEVCIYLGIFQMVTGNAPSDALTDVSQSSTVNHNKNMLTRDKQMASQSIDYTLKHYEYTFECWEPVVTQANQGSEMRQDDHNMHTPGLMAGVMWGGESALNVNRPTQRYCWQDWATEMNEKDTSDERCLHVYTE